MHLLTRPCPGRVAYRVRCAPVCAEQGCDIQTTAKFGLERPCLLIRLHVVHAVDNVGGQLGAIHLVSTVRGTGLWEMHAKRLSSSNKVSDDDKEAVDQITRTPQGTFVHQFPSNSQVGSRI